MFDAVRQLLQPAGSETAAADGPRAANAMMEGCLALTLVQQATRRFKAKVNNQQSTIQRKAGKDMSELAVCICLKRRAGRRLGQGKSNVKGAFKVVESVCWSSEGLGTYTCWWP